MQSRSEFENESRRWVRHVKENEDSHTLLLFGSRFINVRKDDVSVTPNLIRDGFWEAWVSTWFAEQVTPETTFVDIGANCGYYSVLASLYTNDIIAIEPNPQYTSLLETTSTQLSGLGIDIKVYDHAVGDKAETAVLRVPGKMDGSATLANVEFESPEVSEFDVVTRTLDPNLVEEGSTVLIKMDVEGLEEKVWRGAKKFLTTHSPVVFMEYTPGAYSNRFVGALEKYGELSYVDFDGREQPLDIERLKTATDWMTIVVRPR